MKTTYKRRIADGVLKDKLSYMGAVLVRGPKWCGKTTTCEQVAQSAIYMDDPELMEQNQNYAAINVKDLLRGAQPRLIDEWQLAPQFWDAVRFKVDHSAGFGQFILTGSSVPPEADSKSKPEIRKIHRAVRSVQRFLILERYIPVHQHIGDNYLRFRPHKIL